MNAGHHATSVNNRYFTTESIILGMGLGFLFVMIDGYIPWFKTGEGPMIHEPIAETNTLALLLLAVVPFCGFRLPTFFATPITQILGRNVPDWISGFFLRLAVGTLLFLCGFISLGFDSFAVVMLLQLVEFKPYEGRTFFSHRFSVFVIRAIGTISALTVGCGFYPGELWALPHYLSSGMNNIHAGLPMLAVMIPFAIIASTIGAVFFPVRIQPVAFDKKQIIAGLKFAFFLGVYLATHRVLFSAGVFLLFASATGQITRMIEGLLHELKEGGFSAIGLVLSALCIKVGIPGSMHWFASNVTGWKIGLLSAISSPFAGAMVAPSTSYEQLYATISWLGIGAGVAVSSSLVGIMVFRDKIDVEDMPRVLRGIPGVSNGKYAQEAVVYSLVVAFFLAILCPMLWVANSSGFLARTGEAIMGPWPGITVTEINESHH